MFRHHSIKKYLVSRRLALLFIVVVALSDLHAQVNVSLTLRPPYSANIRDYYHLENKAVIVLTNTTSTSLDIKLGGSIVNESRGVYIRTSREFQPAMPITIAPNATVVLSANGDAMNFFDQNNVQTNANDEMLATIIRTGALPEGLYQVCVVAYDYRTNRQLSNAGAGCFTFNVALLAPPLITFPQNNYVYPPEQKNLNFSWTPPLGNLAGAMIEYDQVVVKVQPGQNPNDAIAAARDFNANNPVLYKRNLPGQTYITQPYDLPFEPNQTYAMQIIAKDRSQKLRMTNEGRSEIVVFSIGAKGNVGIDDGPSMGTIDPAFTMVQLSGSLRYYWTVQGTASNVNNHGNSVSNTAGQGTGGTSQQGMAAGASVQDQHQASTNNRGGFSNYQSSPLAGVTVQLVQALQFSNPVINNGGGGIQLLPGNILITGTSATTSSGTISLPVMATATTGAGGKFNFNVPNLGSVDFSWKNGAVGSFSGEFAANVSGQYRRILMVKIASPGATYYADPIQFINNIPGDKDMGTFYARVKTFNTTILVADADDREQTKDGMEVLIMRKDPRPLLVPKDELSPGNFNANENITIGGISYQVLAKATTASNGEATFRNVVYAGCVNNQTPYFIYARPKDEFNTDLSLHNTVRMYKYAGKSQWNENSSCYIESQNTLTYDCVFGNCLTTMGEMSAYSIPSQDPAPSKYFIQFTINVKPRVYGQVKNAAAGNNSDLAQNEANARWYLWKISKAGMQSARQFASQERWGKLLEESQLTGLNMLKVALEQNGTPMVMERTGLTGSDGRVDEDKLPVEGAFSNPQGFYYVLQVDKSGFETAIVPVNKLSTFTAAEGGDMAIVRPGKAYNVGEIWLKPKGKVTLTLVNERGNPVRARAWYYDPQTNQVGQVKESFVIPGSSERRILLDVPSGNNRKIIVQPDNADLYDRDTITLNVPSNDDIEREVVVKYRLHRIYFNVRGFNNAALDKAKVELVLVNGAAEMYNDLSSPYIGEGTFSLPANQFSNQPVGNNNPEIISAYTKHTNNGGGVDFAFKNAGTQFKFRITGPSGTSYVVIDKNVSSSAGKNWKRVDVQLRRGRTVKGSVKFGQVPVANARVRVKGSMPLIEVFTNSAGEYVMNGVPADTILTFTSSKTGYVGMEFTEGQSQASVYGIVNYNHVTVQSLATTTINFKLRIYDGLDLSKLLGFPLEVTALTESQPQLPGRGSASPKSVRISGLVTVSDSLNDVFKMQGTNADGKRLSTIDFTDVVVVADDIKNDSLIPYSRPRTLPMPTDINEQSVTIFNQYQASLYNYEQGIALNNYNAGGSAQGVAQGRVKVEASSFSDNSIGLGQDQSINLVNAEDNLSVTVPVFTAQGSSVLNTAQGISIASEAGSDLDYLLHGFTAIAGRAGSKLYKDSVILDTRLQTSLQHVPQPNLDLAIGRVKINKQREVENVSNAINQVRKLDSFSLAFNHVSITDAGVRFNGTLNAAGMSMPVIGADLYPDHFHIAQGSLQTGNVKLMNAIPVDVTSAASFGYDATRSIPAWYLSITSQENSEAAATISGQHLDALSAAATIPLSSIWFYSNGDQQVNLRSNLPSYKVHNIADLTLQNIFLQDNLLTLSGQLDPGIPAFPTYATALLYDKTGSNTISSMHLRPFGMNDVPVNGVVLGFNNSNSNSISFTDGKIVVRGTIRDENPEVFKGVLYTLTKTNQKTELVLDETPQKQSMQLGGSSSQSRIILSNLEGKMWVTNTSWNHLYIAGDMPEDMGFTSDGKRMRFEVRGALSADNQAVKLKNISTPFGDLSLQYDMQAHRLMGNLSFENTVGTMSVQGDAEMVVDKGGYYFMAGGAMQMSNPRVEGATFMLFGDYNHKQSDRRTAIEDMLKEYSYYYQNLNELPRGYTNMSAINGFFFEAGAKIPVPVIPNFDIDLVVVSAALEVNVGGDVRLAMGFGETNMYNLGLGVFIDARFKLGASIGLACAGVELNAKAGVDLDGTYWSNGNYSMLAQGFFSLTGEAWAGAGIACDSDCDGACVATYAGGTVGLRVTGTVTHNDSDFRIVFDGNSFQ